MLARALAKAPQDRYPSAGDFGRAVLAAAEGRSVTEEERSVARGAAAPTIRRDGALWSGTSSRLRRRTPRPRRRRAGADPHLPRAAPAAPVGVGVGRGRGRGAAVAIAVVPGGGGPPSPGEPVSESEVRRMANSFASAYADEDVKRLTRLLTSDVQRVSPTAASAAARTVVAAYESQFAGQQTLAFDLDDLEAESGASGRATAKYRVRYKGRADTTGTMTWTVINERGRPRITLISFRPG